MAFGPFACSLFTPTTATAQQITTLIEFTNVWRYDQSGRDLGAAWRTNDYDDSTWPSGRGLLGFDDPVIQYFLNVPSGIGTVFASPLSQSVTTYYFRTTFEFTGSTQALALRATNVVDDGCAIWLNGRLAGGVRMPANFNVTTLFTGPPVEGGFEVVNLTNFLRQGVNQLAVEVHQSSVPNSDVMFGMRLNAVRQTPLTITNQPQSQTVTVGERVTLTVGVEGGPVACFWDKDGVRQSSISNSLVIVSATFGNAGSYRVICSNAVSVVTSSVAVVSVVEDRAGPRVIEAINGSIVSAVTSSILIRFSEIMLSMPITHPFSVRNTNNYAVTRIDTGRKVDFTEVHYAPASSLGALLRIDSSDPDWVPYADYVVTINNVCDVRTNAIAPNTRVPVFWPHTTNLLSSSQAWDFHDSAIFDPGVYDEPWFAPNYIPGPWWGQGSGAFYGGPTLTFPCSNFGASQVPISYQPNPTLFRTTFRWPQHWPDSGTLRLRFAADDGFVLYLNGAEIYRTNVAGSVGSMVTSNSLALQAVASPVCVTNVSVNVAGLRPGTNWLAAALLQSVVDQQNSYFAFGMDGVALIAPILAPEPPPALLASPLDTEDVRLSWSGSGYALETSTNLDLGPLSYPAGPWMEVPRMSNPYVWPLTNGTPRYFRLRK